MISNLEPEYALYLKSVIVSNSRSQVITDAQLTCDAIDALEAMDNYIANTSQDERDYYQQLKLYCLGVVANMPVIGA